MTCTGCGKPTTPEDAVTCSDCRRPVCSDCERTCLSSEFVGCPGCHDNQCRYAECWSLHEEAGQAHLMQNPVQRCLRMPKSFKPQVYVSSTGAEYEELPWSGLQRFRRKGGTCQLCGVSLASHAVLGCDLGELI